MTNDIKTYEKFSDELSENLERSNFVDTTSEPEFLFIKIAALKQQRLVIDKQIDGIEQLVSLQ